MASLSRQPRSPAPRLALLAAAAFLTACNGVAGPSASNPLTYGEQWRQELPEVLAEASDFQVAILEDGEVTTAEHERAQLAYLDCLERSGVQVVHLDRYENGLIRGISFASGEDPDQAARDEQLQAECEMEHYTYVAQAWAILLNPNDSEEALLARMAECLLDLGYEVPTSPATITELREAVRDDSLEGIRDLGRCGDEVQFEGAQEGAPED